MKEANYAPIYAAALYPQLAEIARKHGYALSVHGSLARDFDLFCVPWSEKISEPIEVIKAICSKFYIRQIGEGTLRNHGRIAYTLSIGHGECACDVSFIPVKAPDEQK